MYRPMVRPGVIALSKICEAFETPGLDKEEVESVTTAFAALMWQEGGVLDARVLCALAIIGVAAPRVLQKVTDLERAKRQAKQGVQVEKTVQGQVIRMETNK